MGMTMAFPQGQRKYAYSLSLWCPQMLICFAPEVVKWNSTWKPHNVSSPQQDYFTDNTELNYFWLSDIQWSGEGESVNMKCMLVLIINI